jgi:hypothetical protein
MKKTTKKDIILKLPSFSELEAPLESEVYYTKVELSSQEVLEMLELDEPALKKTKVELEQPPQAKPKPLIPVGYRISNKNGQKTLVKINP